MRTETIDGVVYYVWKDGDELPDYQPIGLQFQGALTSTWRDASLTNPKDWERPHTRRWPKLLNDRARHQRMIDEAFEKLSCDKEPFDFYTIKSDMEHALVDYGIFNEECMLFLVKSSANIKRMMEHVQAEIDKESEVNT